jgi:Carboxypeptidase regulatory-like domain
MVLANGEPVIGAQVWLSSSYEDAKGEVLARGVTGSEGEFDLGGIGTRQVRLTASANGARPQTSFLDLRDPTLVADALVIRLDACATLRSVRVEDASRNLLQPAHLRIGGAEGLQLGGTVLAAGVGQICARAGDFVEARVDGYGRQVTEVPPGARTPITLTLAPAGSLFGRVLDAGGEPVPAALVWISALQGEPKVYADRALTDAEGVFEIRDLPARTFLVQAYGDSGMLLRPVSVEVRATQQTRVELRLASTTTVEGSLLGPDGAPLPGVEIRFARTTDGMTSRAGVSDDRGHFIATQVAPGRNRVFVLGYQGAAPSEIEVETGPGTPVVVRVAGPRSVRGRVAKAGSPVEGATIVASCGGRGASAADGGFTIALGGYGMETCRLEASKDGALAPPQAFSVDDPAAFVELELQAGVRVHGRAVEPEGRPLPGVTVLGRRVDTGQHFEATSEADGTFVTAPLLPGPWSISVASGQGLLTLVEPSPSTVEIRPGTVLAVVAEHGGARVTGVVRHRGAAVADATVVLDGPNRARRLLVTDGAGEFTSEIVPRGPYRLSVRAGALWASADVVVPAAQPIALELVEGASVRGTVVGESDVLVTVVPRADARDAQSLFSDGPAFVMEGLPSGPAVVMVAKGARRALREVVLEAGRTTNVSLALPGSTDLLARVVDAKSGQPLAGVSCHLAIEGALSAGVRRSNGAGELRFERAPAGRGELRCWGAPGQLNEWTTAVDTSVSVALDVRI